MSGFDLEDYGAARTGIPDAGGEIVAYVVHRPLLTGHQTAMSRMERRRQKTAPAVPEMAHVEELPEDAGDDARKAHLAAVLERNEEWGDYAEAVDAWQQSTRPDAIREARNLLDDRVLRFEDIKINGEEQTDSKTVLDAMALMGGDGDKGFMLILLVSLIGNAGRVSATEEKD